MRWICGYDSGTSPVVRISSNSIFIGAAILGGMVTALIDTHTNSQYNASNFLFLLRFIGMPSHFRHLGFHAIENLYEFLVVSETVIQRVY
jgi:hypothetical protein